MNLNLEDFSHFPIPTPEEWTQQILKDLKLDSLDSLKHTTDWGYTQEVFYYQNNHPQPILFDGNFRFFSYIPFHASGREINARIHHALQLGASGLCIDLSKQVDNFNDILSNVQEDILKIFFLLSNDTFYSLKKENPAFFEKYSSSFLLDSLSLALRYGEWHSGRTEDFVCLEDEIPVFADASLYKEAGANVLQQLTFALLHLYELLLHYPERRAKDLVIHVRFSQGISFFEEMAKLRAFRRLIPELEKIFGIKARWYLHGVHSLQYASPSDPYNNLLRLTTQAVSSIAGTCEYFTSLPFDLGFRDWNRFSAALAVQMMHTLCEESFLHRLQDAVCGSYYVEALTDELVNRAREDWKKWQEKGMLYLIENGIIQQHISQQCCKTAEEYRSGKKKLIGENIFPAPEWMEKFSAPRNTFIKGKHFPALNPVYWFDFLQHEKQK